MNKTSKLLITAIVILFTFTYACSKSAEPTPSTLKDAFEGKFLIGTALNARQIMGIDTMGIKVVKEHFNAIVAENCMKSEEIQPREGEFNFTLADKFVEFGEQNNIAITGHALIWHSQLPRWFAVDQNGNDVSPEVLKERMKTHINTLVSRYKGRIKGWDVVNEAILDDGSYRNSKFYQILGEEFIPLAFQYAHEADPDAELYYNDYNEWHVGKRETIVKLIKTLKERGIRIDAIGMQGHMDLKGPRIEEYKAAIDAYADAGVKVMVTELDVTALPYPWENVGANLADTASYKQEMNPYTEGLPDSISQVWNKRVGEIFDLLLDNQDKILRVTLWGVADSDSWKNGFPIRGRVDYPLLFDRNHEPKPIVTKLINDEIERRKANK